MTGQQFTISGSSVDSDSMIDLSMNHDREVGRRILPPQRERERSRDQPPNKEPVKWRQNASLKIRRADKLKPKKVSRFFVRFQLMKACRTISKLRAENPSGHQNASPSFNSSKPQNNSWHDIFCHRPARCSGFKKTQWIQWRREAKTKADSLPSFSTKLTDAETKKRHMCNRVAKEVISIADIEEAYIWFKFYCRRHKVNVVGLR